MGNIPLRDKYFENLSHNLSDAIYTANSELYAHIMEHSYKARQGLSSQEYSIFRDRVRYLVEQTSNN